MTRIKSTILIGGILSEAFVPEFCSLIADNLVSLRKGGAAFRPKDAKELLGACLKIDGISTLSLFTHDGVLGGFPLIEIFALRHKLDYTLYSGGYLISRPFIVEHRGNLNFYFKTNADQDFDPLIDGHTLQLLKQCTSQDQVQCILSEALPEIEPRNQFLVDSIQHK